jgi:hypothetical protein
MTDPVIAAEQTEQRETPRPVTTPATAAANTASGKIFSNITHTLSDSELTSLPVVKLILDRAYYAEAKRDDSISALQRARGIRTIRHRGTTAVPFCGSAMRAASTRQSAVRYIQGTGEGVVVGLLQRTTGQRHIVA